MHLQNVRYRWWETQIEGGDMRERSIPCLLLLEMLLPFGAADPSSSKHPLPPVCHPGGHRKGSSDNLPLWWAGVIHHSAADRECTALQQFPEHPGFSWGFGAALLLIAVLFVL